jgi:hypothetical protein
MSTAYNRVRALAKQFGATIHININEPGGMLDVGVEAPPNHVWSGEDLHEFVGHTQTGGVDRHEMWEDLLDRMSDGVEPCPYLGGSDGCEWCDGE